jgi:exocyst complex component 7
MVAVATIEGQGKVVES